MSRVKFRAILKRKNRMVHGNYVYNEQTENHMIATPKNLETEQVKKTMNTDFGNSYNFWIVKPETVSQYTGLQDKYGKDIYEGDILNSGEIVTNIHGNYEPVIELETGYCEVIGNIYENPELLK